MISRPTTRFANNSPVCVLAALFSLMAGMAGFGQNSGATVTFANNGSCRIVDGSTGAAVCTNGNSQVALFCAPTNSSVFTQVGAAVTVGWPVAGIFAGGTRDCAGLIEAGGVAQFQVRAWPKGFATFDDAVAAGAPIGQSTVLQIQTGNGNVIPAVPPPALAANGLQSFTISAGNHPNQLSINFVNGHTVVSVAAIPGATYSMQSAPTINGPWTDLSGPITSGPDAHVSCRDEQPSTDTRFYRALVQP